MKLNALFSKVSLLISVLVGIFFLVMGVVLLVRPDTHDAETEGVITDIQLVEQNIVETADGFETEETYCVLVSFEAGGKKFENVELGAYSSDMEVGQSVKILYNSADPSDYAAESSPLLPFIMMAIGVVIAAFGGFGIRKFKRA